MGQEVVSKSATRASEGICGTDLVEDAEFSAEFARILEVCDHRPMLVVDRNLSLVWSCDRSRALLNNPVPLCIRDGYLVVDDELGPGRFETFLQSLDEIPRRFLVRSRSSPHWAMVCAWRSPAFASHIFIMCSLSVPHCEVADSGIAEDLGLTRAETVVLREFAMLKAPKEIADELGISLSTVRSHLKQIYAKAAVQTGLQLFLLVQTYCAV